MQMRIIYLGAAVAAIVLALTVARTDALAASDKESCSTTSTDVTHTNADTTAAICDASIGAPNKATAHASNLGVAEAVVENMGTVTAHAKNGSFAEAVGNGGTATASSSGVGTEAVAGADLSGKAKATARNTGSTFGAEAIANAACKATANSNGAGSLAIAECIIGGSSVSAHATRGSTAKGSDTLAPVCTPMNGGIAKVRSPMGNCG